MIGAGRIGTVHAIAIASDANAILHSVVDFHQESAEKLAQKYNAITLNLDEAFNNDEIDAFIIASSTSTHADLIERCAEVGKPVFCEKPIDLSLDRALSCAKAVEESGIICMLGFNRRFDPHMASLKSKVDANAIGSIQSLLITSHDPEPPSMDYIAGSGGLFHDMMIHDFDMACWILNDTPRSIYVSANAANDDIAKQGDVDTASVIMNMNKGAIVTIINGRQASFGYDQRIEAFGETGMLQVKNALEDNVVLSNSMGINQAKSQHFFLERYEKAFHNELIHFMKSFQSGTQPSVNISDGVLALKIAEAAKESLQSGNSINL
ncbi:MAG: myo-inositol 2-dehydrogenase/D-chiro-inositol 1-dehydrogenase [Candidatus Pseudothioglobus sp.]|jgi:myo-inositol 2-dehydrogenase/D-chiro-inositol 1-dehydrogenase|tara:strand:+ start:4645 stop:5613 length:969 start_codon:yes stop_codon:yes gene_type:complete